MNQVKEFFQYIFGNLKFWIIVQPWEKGIRVRKGKHIKKLSAGIYFVIPYLDSVYVQECRLRVCSMSMQTLTSKDRATITMNGSIGYSIKDIEKLYNTLYHPEMTIANIVMSETAEFVYANDAIDTKPADIQNAVMKKLQATDYGLNFQYYKVTNFAMIKAFRLIQDQSWYDSSFRLDEKKK